MPKNAFLTFFGSRNENAVSATLYQKMGSDPFFANIRFFRFVFYEGKRGLTPFFDAGTSMYRG